MVVLEEVMLEQDAGELQTPCEQTLQHSMGSNGRARSLQMLRREKLLEQVSQESWGCPILGSRLGWVGL